MEDDETKMDKNLQQVDEAASELVRCFSGGKFNFMVSKRLKAHIRKTSFDI